MDNKYCPKMSQEPYAGAWGLCHEKNNQGVSSNDYKVCSCDYINSDYHNCKYYRDWKVWLDSSSAINMY
jgi:hypothetical protein